MGSIVALVGLGLEPTRGFRALRDGAGPLRGRDLQRDPGGYRLI